MQKLVVSVSLVGSKKEVLGGYWVEWDMHTIG